MKQVNKRKKKPLALSYSLEEEKSKTLFGYCLLSLKPPTLYLELYFFKVLISLSTEPNNIGLEVL